MGAAIATSGVESGTARGLRHTRAAARARCSHPTVTPRRPTAGPNPEVMQRFSTSSAGTCIGHATMRSAEHAEIPGEFVAVTCDDLGARTVRNREDDDITGDGPIRGALLDQGGGITARRVAERVSTTRGRSPGTVRTRPAWPARSRVDFRSIGARSVRARHASAPVCDRLRPRHGRALHRPCRTIRHGRR